MIATLASALLALSSSYVHSAPEDYFYVCRGIAGIEEYRVGINVRSNKAGFFDNESTSYMELTKIKNIQGPPPQKIMIFEGEEAISKGSLKLYFNFTKKRAHLNSIDEKGNSSLLGTAPCLNDEPWDDLN